MSQLQGKLRTKITYQKHFDLLIEEVQQYDNQQLKSHQHWHMKWSIDEHNFNNTYDTTYIDHTSAWNNDDNMYDSNVHNIDTPVYELNKVCQHNLDTPVYELKCYTKPHICFYQNQHGILFLPMTMGSTIR